ncbi:hypothetical protein Pmani_021857 [Petrolisthes manimaculis]|uniref:Small ribosomal subunit protein uS15m n=1 Tax=Petrolisthes manimaculis TaxID=1843537 RepID=A0AAE1U2P6_9EUCA|nr:hypothetical protein Pmani_021857 [Petrolisthes manimaculis]
MGRILAVNMRNSVAVGSNNGNLTRTQLLLIADGRHETRCGYAMKQELTENGIIWRRPEHLPAWHPKKSGELKTPTPLDLTRLRKDVLPAASMMEEVNEVTQQLLSLKFARSSEHSKVEKQDVLCQIRRHKYDCGSIEARIGMLTVKIRRLQDKMFVCKKNALERVHLQETIDRRNKLLRKLRNHDYKCFEWLIEKLEILHRPFPDPTERRSRKRSLRKLVQLYGKDLQEKRLAEYQEALEKKKEPFLKEKTETLRWIVETEASLGVPISVSVPGEETEESDTQGR